MRIAVVGAGGVGGYFGGQLAAAGHEVVFIARGRQLGALRGQGLTVLSEHAPVRLPKVEATEQLTAVAGASLVLIAVKLWDTEEIARQLGSVADFDGAVLSLQNGVQKDLDLARHLPTDNLLGGACYISAFIERPGVIRHNGSLARIAFGEYGRGRTDRTNAIEDALNQANIENQRHAGMSPGSATT